MMNALLTKYPVTIGRLDLFSGLVFSHRAPRVKWSQEPDGADILA